ncbi:MAG TPA: histidine kinase [Phenylobacterium sp.]|jgi:two-component system sensor histidine kinase UhpB|uniref:histidine kinase n=1 Tax=Phenylobacterium sp. TaxID=1871053 RepID=UPI002D2A1AE7|nr:histidine kinase [Phenylobacterium sp.]HZZ68166.1 histidine kinase [Phenylobacterium sp.]
MSLRARVVALIAGVLLISLLLGAAAAGYQAREALSAELAAGLGGAQQTVNSAFEDLPNSDHPARDLRQLVATFDGNRHVRASLMIPGGRAALTSHTRSAGAPAPPWFGRLLGPSPAARQIAVPGHAAGFEAIVLAPTAEADVGAAWGEFTGIVTALTGSAAVGLILVYLVISAAFRPLRALADQFGRVGAGDYSGRVAERGPTELLGLQRGFNRMAGELAATTERNRLLGDQLLTLQEEERADIARDLHDDIGPHLFAVNMDAEMIAQLGEAGRHEGVTEHVRSIQAAVKHMQRQVRDLLSRLRPARITELGLNAAILDLVRFWSARRPDIAFNLTLLDEEAELPEATKDVVYRVVQEAANNAVRHGSPKTVRIALWIDADETLSISVADDGTGHDAAPTLGGLGLVGMRERVASVGGTLSSGPNHAGMGWTTIARLRLDGAAAAQPSEAAA